VSRPPFPGRAPRLFGHRGAAGVAPENTLPSFQRALADGADVLELDVHATADGEIVVLHDPTLERTTDGAGPVKSVGFAELARLDAGFRFSPDGGRTFPFRAQGVAIPRLADVIRDCPRVPLNVEIKQEEPSIVSEVVALLRATRTRVILAAEIDAIMHAIRTAAPDMPTSLAALEVAAFVSALEAGEQPCLPAGAVALQIPPRFGSVTLVTPESLAAAHAIGAEVHVWTINDPDEMRRLLALGCDGIMSDFPARARAVIAEGVRRA
jgi:glycerophosphoryl diester phosphodiesterase